MKVKIGLDDEGNAIAVFTESNWCIRTYDNKKIDQVIEQEVDCSDAWDILKDFIKTKAQNSPGG